MSPRSLGAPGIAALLLLALAAPAGASSISYAGDTLVFAVAPDVHRAVRLTAAGRRRLRHAHRAVLTLSAGTARGRVVLRGLR